MLIFIHIVAYINYCWLEIEGWRMGSIGSNVVLQTVNVLLLRPQLYNIEQERLNSCVRSVIEQLKRMEKKLNKLTRPFKAVSKKLRIALQH